MVEPPNILETLDTPLFVGAGTCGKIQAESQQNPIGMGTDNIISSEVWAHLTDVIGR